MSEWTLRPGPFAGRGGPLLTVVLDGIGCGHGNTGDAVHRAYTPTLDRIWSGFQTKKLCAHGRAVGMPSDSDMGNSEVGHNALGAGRVFDQGATLVERALRDGSVFRGKVWRDLVANARQNKTPIHFIGLVSDGNVHSHIDHLLLMIRRADEEHVSELCLHVLFDGRDVAGQSALGYLSALDELLAEINSRGDRDYRIASGGGRMRVTMDRYEDDWAIVERGWRAHVLGEGSRFPSARAAVEAYRAADPQLNDQFLGEFVVIRDGRPAGAIEDNHSVVVFNFRGDRAIELCRAFEEDEFSAFARQRRPKVVFAGMTLYDGDLQIPSRFLVEPPRISRTIGEYLVRNKIPLFACSETQKFGHVTYFWNGNRSGAFDSTLETYVNIPSDHHPYEERPWMKAAQITDATLKSLREGRARHLRINYPNGDMVGHTGDLGAAILAVECVDLALGRLLQEVERVKGIALVTADHGNADQMFEEESDHQIRRNKNGQPSIRTAHSLNPVPFTVVDAGFRGEYEFDPSIENPRLSHVAATALFLSGYSAPEGYDPSLVRLT